MQNIRLPIFLLTLLTSCFAIADNETDGGGEGENASDQALVITKDYKFQPAELTVPVGTTVRWENREVRQRLVSREGRGTGGLLRPRRVGDAHLQ